MLAPGPQRILRTGDVVTIVGCQWAVVSSDFSDPISIRARGHAGGPGLAGAFETLPVEWTRVGTADAARARVLFPRGNGGNCTSPTTGAALPAVSNIELEIPPATSWVIEAAFCPVVYPTRIETLTIGGTCLADFNADGGVTIDDQALFLQRFEQGSPTADLNGDRGVDINDLLVFLAHFEAGC